MKVTVELDERTWWRIGAAAEANGRTIGAELSRAIIREFEVFDRRDSFETVLRRMHAAGCHDGEISVELGVPRAWVARKRRDLGLPANRQFVKRGAA